MKTGKIKSDDINAKLIDVRSSLDALYYMIVGLYSLDVIEIRDKDAFTFLICNAADNVDLIIKSESK